MKKISIILLIGVFLLASFLLKDYMSMEFLNEYKDVIAAFVLNNYYFSVILFIVACALFVNSPIPLAGVLKIMGGFLFGATLGSVFNIVGTLIGALVGFSIARYLLHDLFEKKYGKRLHPVKDEIKNNGLMYFMALRFTLIFPYFLIHILGGISKINYWKYFVSTLIGVIPGSIIYGYTGNQIEQVDQVHDMFTWEIGIMTSLLIVFSLLPVIVKKMKPAFVRLRTRES